ncbi:unnamed protein product [Caenorhabditis brenneri]
MHKNIPFFVKNLPFLLLSICTVHLVAKSCLLKHQLYYVDINFTNTHFALTAVITGFLCLLISLIIVDTLFHTHFTFRYVIGMNISVVACCLFTIGYILGHIVEIWFAQMTKYTCRQLGISSKFANTTESRLNDVEEFEETRCNEAVALEFQEISIDLLIHIFFIPLHISATAFSWTFAGLYRKRGHDDYE